MARPLGGGGRLARGRHRRRARPDRPARPACRGWPSPRTCSSPSTGTPRDGRPIGGAALGAVALAAAAPRTAASTGTDAARRDLPGGIRAFQTARARRSSTGCPSSAPSSSATSCSAPARSRARPTTRSASAPSGWLGKPTHDDLRESLPLDPPPGRLRVEAALLDPRCTCWSPAWVKATNRAGRGGPLQPASVDGCGRSFEELAAQLLVQQPARLVPGLRRPGDLSMANPAALIPDGHRACDSAVVVWLDLRRSPDVRARG